MAGFITLSMLPEAEVAMVKHGWIMRSNEYVMDTARKWSFFRGPSCTYKELLFLYAVYERALSDCRGDDRRHRDG